MDIYALLIIGHLAGTVLGIGGATMIEVHLNKAMLLNMSADARSMLGLDFVVLRIGLVLSIFTGIGFIILYKFSGQEFRLQNPVFWAKMCMVVIVAVNALLLQAHKIGLYWGSALSFVTWWAAGLLGVFLTNTIRVNFISQINDFFEIMIIYALTVIVGAFVLHKIRGFVKSRHV